MINKMRELPDLGPFGCLLFGAVFGLALTVAFWAIFGLLPLLAR